MSQAAGMWSETVGLVNGQNKYLTAETFGFNINANGVGLKKKQLWSIEAFPLEIATEQVSELEHVAIKSHLGCYLAVDSYGNVTCDSQQVTKGACFTITICAMSGAGDSEQIYWAFRNVERGYYLGTNNDGTVSCQAKMPQSRAELWHIHLVPARGATMFALKSVSRKRFARSTESTGNDSERKEQIQLDSTTPWGSETLFQFKYFDGGYYALLTSTCKYLTFEGSCISWTPEKTGAGSGLVKSGVQALPPPETLFTIEYHGGNIAFRDQQGRYLAGVGRSAVLKSRAVNVSRDELFEIEQAPIQVALRANLNQKWVSIKQSFDVSANQNDISSQHETFQLEFERGGTWRIRSKEGSYWTLGAASGVQASGADEKSAGHFRLKWNSEDGTCNILASASVRDDETSKWVQARKSGLLYVGNADPVGFFVVFQNCTVLNLRASTSSGFVGLKFPGTSKLETTKTSPDSVNVEYANNETTSSDDKCSFNCCYFRMPVNNKYWSVIDGNQVACDSTSKDAAQRFLIELRSSCLIAIRLFESSSYLNLTNQGTLVVKACPENEATLWEF